MKKWDDLIMPFQFGVKLEYTNPNSKSGYEFWTEMFHLYFLDKNKLEIKIQNIINDGKILRRYQKKQNESLSNFLCFDAELEGLKLIVANTPIKNAQFFDSKYDPLVHDAMLAFSWNRTEYSVSLYTTKDSDLSEIARKFGGGGHKQAAGFSCKDIKFNDGKVEVIK
jgi:nanoRNase/pAp phosphatase (c-di-AMP/oligoRNAs hydrolase)